MDELKNKILKQRKPKKFRAILSIMLVGLVLAVSLILFPSFANELNNITQVMSVGGYVDNIVNLSSEEIAQIKQEAKEYNQRIYEEQQRTPFYYQGPEVESEEYRTILNIITCM